jgi:hypothetical protein
MSTTKLFLYKAQDANTAVLLRRGIYKTDWEMIHWSMDTDEFTRGQWLCGATMNGAKQSISPDGRYFGYHYSDYRNGRYDCFGVVSRIPMFTASVFMPNFAGEWETIEWTRDNTVVCNYTDWELRTSEINVVRKTKETPVIPGGYIDLQNRTWTDTRGRSISVDAGILLADGAILLDTTADKFREVSPV